VLTLLKIYLWNVIEARLASDRTRHIAFSWRRNRNRRQLYVCADLGWVKAENADIKYLSDEYGLGAVYSVQEKVNS
jgi:hypothetical protein